MTRVLPVVSSAGSVARGLPVVRALVSGWVQGARMLLGGSTAPGPSRARPGLGDVAKGVSG
ncbi:hypothetical protein [Streptomyces pseudovenezuelae]|uniref:hypothetical protein n=1 Tax=Streptomyces pseudovenezuelae TaxID=67350 RepID=UPI0036E67E05